MYHTNRFILILSFLASIVLMLACTNKEIAVEEKDHQYCLPETMAEKIAIEDVEELQEYRLLNLPGQVMVNKDKVYRVYPAAGGLISHVHVRMGDKVNRGQILATVYSPDVPEFKRDKQSAEADKSIAKQNYELAKSLHEAGVYSERDLKEAKSAFERAEYELNRLFEQQRLLGLADDQTAYTIRAPQAGFIIERNINPGMTLRADDEYVFKISGLDDVWVIANVSESDIKNVRESDQVLISTLAFPDRQFTGEIVRFSSTVNPASRTMEAIIELPNPDFLLKPGMFANIQVQANKVGRYPAVSAKALIFDNNRHYLVVYRDSCDMEVREVIISSQNGEKAFIQSGIKKGEKIVANRQLLVYNELMMRK